MMQTRLHSWLPLLLLSLLALGVYANSLWNGFVYDDEFGLLRNPLVIDFHSIPAMFGSGVGGVHSGQKATNYYRPMQSLIYMLLYKAAGFDAFAFHLLMILLHAGNTLIVYFLTRRLAGQLEGPALAAAVLFAVHPIHTEVVAWVAALPDMLVTTFVLIAVWLFIRQDSCPRRLGIAGHCGLYALALFTKEPGAVLLPLFAGFEWIYLGRRLRDLRANARLYAAMLGTFGFYMILRYAALGGFAPGQQRYYQLTPPVFFLSVVVMVGQYFTNLVLPTNLNFFHTFEPTRTITTAFLISLFAILVLLAAIFVLSRRDHSEQTVPPLPIVSYGIFWLFLTLAPALNLTGVGENVFAERYLYLPSIGFVWTIGLAWHVWARRTPVYAWAVAVAILVTFSGEVYLRNRDFRNNVTLYEATLRGSPLAAPIHTNLAIEYFKRGDPVKALAEARLAVQWKPDSPQFHKNLGIILMRANPTGGLQEFRTAVALNPSDSDVRYNFAVALEEVGDAQAAAVEYEKTLQIEPSHDGALMALAGISFRTGRIQEAIAFCLRAASINVGNPEPYIKLAVLYNTNGQYKEAIDAAGNAIRAGGKSDTVYRAHFELGIAYSYVHSPNLAMAEFRKAYVLHPDFEEARKAYEAIQAQLKQK